MISIIKNYWILFLSIHVPIYLYKLLIYSLIIYENQDEMITLMECIE